MPYWRLSSFYLFYFASLGALVPYWGLYLQGEGFSAAAIGELLAILMATKVIAPNIWGWLADHTGRRMAIVRLASLVAAVCFAGVFLGSGYWWLVFVMSAFSFFWNAALPQLEATTFSHLGYQSHRYTHIRIWGSIGFIVAVWALGPVLDRHGAGVVPVVVLILMAGIWLASLAVPERVVASEHGRPERLRQVLLRPEVLALFGACFLGQMSHGPYYAFYSIYLESHGYSRGAIGQLWALGVLAEVALFLIMHRLLGRFALRLLFIVSFALTSVRWLVIAAFPDAPAIVAAAQLLHAASFGLYHAVAIQLIHRLFTGRHQGRGQALYSSLSFGAGGAAGALASGYAWDWAGPAATYAGAALVAALGLILVWVWVRDPPAARRTEGPGGISPG